MKKLLTLFLVLGAFSSCQMSEFDDFLGGDAEFFAKIEDTKLTKTLMDENNNVLWSAGDQLMIFRQSTLGVKYQVQSKYVGKNHGGFSRVAGETNDDFYAGMALDHNLAYYPYIDGLECSNANSNVPIDCYLITGVVLPQTQIYAQESFCNGAFPMIAVSANKELTFRNVCGGMKLQLKGNQKVTSISVKGNNGEKLGGEAVVTAYVNGSSPVIEMKEDSYTSVILDCGEGVQLDESVATSFIIALPPVEFSKGFEVTVTDSEGNTNTITTDVQNTVLRSSLLTMPAISVSQPGISYNELCSVTEVMYDGFKMHINVPESVENSPHGQLGGRAIRYTHGDLMTYNFMSSSDYYSLLWNGGRYTTEDVTLDYSEVMNFGQSDEDVNEDGVIDENDLVYLWNPIAPGEPIVYLAGEFEWMTEEQNGFEYPLGWEPGYYLPCMSREYLWTGAFQKKQFDSKKPSVLDAEVKMDITNLSPVNATIALTPDPEVQFYCTMILDEASYDFMLELLDGKEEYLQWATSSYFAMYNFGARTLSGSVAFKLSDYFYDVPADTDYHVLITGMGDDKGSRQCFNHYQFRTPQKTKASGPTIVVEPLEDESSSYVAKFRIKCTSPDNPAVRCYYGSNYLKEWIYAINAGGTYLQNGQSMNFSSYEVEMINSSEGLVVSLPSVDGETTRLVVVGYNDENTPNDFNYEDITECPAVADLTTPYYTAPIIRSYYDLSDALSGDWVMSAVVTDYSGNRVTQTQNVSILKELSDYPASTPDEVYDLYEKNSKWTRLEIDGYWSEFKNQAKIFNTRRLANQNKLALVGWLDGGVYGSYQTMLPYDLFISEEYNAFDVKSMFADFGPKMFIEISEDADGKAKLTITADMMYGLPVSYWMGAPFYLAGRSSQNDGNTVFYYSDINGLYNAPLVFDVEYSADFSKLTIKAIDNNGVKYYPNVVGQDLQTGRYMLDYPIISDVVLTKGITKSAVGTCPPQRNVAVTPVNGELNISYKQHTRFEKPVERKNIEMEIMTLEKVQKNLEKYIQKQAR